MVSSGKKPVVGITCCSALNGIHPQQVVGDKYIRAIIEGSDVIPILIPSFGEEMEEVLPYLDGLYLTGSYSNMEPHHFGGKELEEPMVRDPNRDSTNLHLLKKALEINLPVLGICRGFQEMNVALGGSLHQQLFTVADMIEHREDKTGTLEAQYSCSHNIELSQSGLLASIMKGELQQGVNSLHGQGIETLAEQLKVEATAPDGLVEAFSLSNKASYYVGLQWHPEWNANKDPLSIAIFKSFGDACRQYKAVKTN